MLCCWPYLRLPWLPIDAERFKSAGGLESGRNQPRIIQATRPPYHICANRRYTEQRLTCFEGRVLASVRPLYLYDANFVSNHYSIKECILQAIPDFPRQVLGPIDETVKGHIAHDVNAKNSLKKCNLSQLEAEAIIWWTADVSTLSEMLTEESPYYVYNTALRQRNAAKN